MPNCTRIEFLRIKGKTQDEYIPSFDKLLTLGVSIEKQVRKLWYESAMIFVKLTICQSNPWERLQM